MYKKLYMICHRYKCIFIHIPKTAGTSIINAFGKTWDDHQDVLFLLGGNTNSDMDWETYEKKYKDYLIFSVIRNPWDRFISGWKYCHSTKNKSLNDVLINLPKFNENRHDFDHLTRTQCEVIYKKNKLIPNYLLKFENLQSDFNKLCDIVNKPRVILDKLNTTDHNHYSTYFKCNQSKIIFESNYKEDIKKLGYEF